MEKTIPSSWQRRKLTQVKLEDQKFIAPLATSVEKETSKAVDTRSVRQDQHQNFFEVVYSICARFASSRDRSPTDIFGKRKSRKMYFEM